jgi:hypothetical protein
MCANQLVQDQTAPSTASKLCKRRRPWPPKQCGFWLSPRKRITSSAFTFSPFSNRWLILGFCATLGLQVLIVYAQPLFGVSPFRTAPFPVEWWGWITLASASGFLAIELDKLVRRRLGSLAGASG